MNHEEIKILLSAYIDGEVTPSEKDLVENHLVSCESCQKEFAEFKKVSSSLKRWPQERLSPDVELNIKARLAKIKERNMEKQESNIQWSSIAIVIVVMMFSTFAFQQYARRGLQARVRDAGSYLSSQAIALGKTAQYEPYYLSSNYAVERKQEKGLLARLKSATDDIGDQFSPENTAYIHQQGSGAVRAVKAGSDKADTRQLTATTQYQPYYMSANYAVDREENKKGDIVAHRNYPQEQVGRLASASAVGLKDEKSYVPASVSATTGGQPVQYFAKEKAADKLAMLQNNEPLAEYRQQAVMGGVAGGYSVTGQASVSNEGLRADLNGNALERDSERKIYSQPTSTMDYPSQEVIQPYPYPQKQIYLYTPPPTDSESYDRISENGFLSPNQDPLSTFSIDVDTASYSNVRRFLNQGQLPPPDAVRIEEMINYFNYEYPEPGWGQPFSVTTEVTSCPWNPSHQLALIGLHGKRLNSLTMPASNLVFLIDVSGSMNSPNKLPLLQDAFRMMARELEGKDRVSIVVYAGAAGMILDGTPGNYQERIINAVDQLQAGGSTAGGAGIQLAYQAALANFIPNGNNRVILATDGDFNVGVSDDDQLIQMIQNYRDRGIYLTVLGFGMGNLKDSKMEKLADQGNGNYFYIDNINEARKVLVNELGSTLFTIAKDVKIQVEFNPATVASYRLVGYENRTLAKEDFNDDTKDAGELGAGHTVTALYEIVPAGGYPELPGRVDPLVYQKTPQVYRNMFESSDLMTVKLRYKDPKGTMSKLIKKTVGRNDVRINPKSENIRFASAVAEFGLLLRNSPYRGVASFDHVINEARAAKSDRFGYRSEFLELVERAKSLSPYPAPLPVYGDPVIMDRYDYSYSPHEKNQK